MKSLTIILLAFFNIVFSTAHAQTDIPKGFKQGTITLIDGSVVPGSIKDNIRSKASVTFINAAGKKKSYDGSDLLSAEIEGVKFLCVSGDFFRVISDGTLHFLQKSSDASGKVSFNGNIPMLMSGTDGRRGDYFIYVSSNKQLTWVSKKNFVEVTAAIFAGNAAAINKARSVNGDLSRLKEAVDTYNNTGTNQNTLSSSNR